MQQVDVLIITALKEEYDEARKVDVFADGPWTSDTIAGFDVALRTYRALDGQPTRIALTWATHMRTTATADAAGRLIDRLLPRCLSMCGVCAGRRGKMHPGDVIIASLLYTYDTGAIRAEYDENGQRHDRFQADPNPYPLNERWLRRAKAFKILTGATWVGERPVTLEAQGNWLLARLQTGEDPQKHPERSKRCPAWKAVIERLRKLKHLTEQAPLALTPTGIAYIENVLLLHPDGLPEDPALRVHVAPLATGNNVMRDPRLFDRLSDSMREVLGVEMEAAAIGAIAHARGIPWLVMKAAMDFADQDKDDQFKPFAARASAECLIAFLCEHLSEIDSPVAARPDADNKRGEGSESSLPSVHPMGGQQVHNHGPVGHQVNVQGGATINLGVVHRNANES